MSKNKKTLGGVLAALGLGAGYLLYRATSKTKAVTTPNIGGSGLGSGGAPSPPDLVSPQADNAVSGRDSIASGIEDPITKDIYGKTEISSAGFSEYSPSPASQPEGVISLGKGSYIGAAPIAIIDDPGGVFNESLDSIMDNDTPQKWTKTYEATKEHGGSTTTTYQSSSGQQVALAGISAEDYAAYLETKRK